MNSRYLLIQLSISFILLLSCSPEERVSENQLDYSQIPLIGLQKEFSITESEDYIPAQITHLMVSNDGYILVLQRAEKSIHQFDSLGNHIAKVAGPGRGPGELSQYANAHFNGKVLVMSNNNGMITEYRQNNDGIFEYKTDHNFRLPGPMQGIHSANDELSAFYVRVDSVRTPFGIIPPEFTTDFVHLVQIVDDSLQIEEKVLSLNKHSSYIEITNGGSSMTYSSLPYRYSDHFSPLNDKFILVKRPGKSVIQIYDENMRLFHELKLNVKERLVTEKDIEYHFPENSPTERRNRRAMIKDIKPPFMGVMIDDQSRFWLSIDKTETGKEYVILSYEGIPLGRFFLPSNSVLHAVKNGKLYIVNNEEETSIEVYSVNL